MPCVCLTFIKKINNNFKRKRKIGTLIKKNGEQDQYYQSIEYTVRFIFEFDVKVNQLPT